MKIRRSASNKQCVKGPNMVADTDSKMLTPEFVNLPMSLKGYWLVVWNMFYFSIYWEFHHPNWRTHIFQRGRYTTNQDSRCVLCLVCPEKDISRALMVLPARQSLALWLFFRRWAMVEIVGSCFFWKSMSRQSCYPLVNKQKAMENGPFIDGLPIKHGDFL